MPKSAADKRPTADVDGRRVHIQAVMTAAERLGLLNDKRVRIAGRVSAALVAQAKKRSGIQTDTDLIAFALANVALEDDFAETFKKVHGTVDANLKLGF
ncbi:hypothetical protein BH10PSE6_BH10PSE6_47490 [soil metagenome]